MDCSNISFQAKKLFYSKNGKKEKQLKFLLVTPVTQLTTLSFSLLTAVSSQLQCNHLKPKSNQHFISPLVTELNQTYGSKVIEKKILSTEKIVLFVRVPKGMQGEQCGEYET